MKKTSIELETVVKLILFLISAIVVLSIFKLVVSKIFSNIGLQLCSISFSLKEKSQEKSYVNPTKYLYSLTSHFIGLGCSPGQEKIKVVNKEELLVDLLIKFKKICDITQKGNLNIDKTNIFILTILPKSNFDISTQEIEKLNSAYLITIYGKTLDITLSQYCNNVNIVVKDPISFKKNEEKTIIISYKKEKDGLPTIIIEQ